MLWIPFLKGKNFHWGSAPDPVPNFPALSAQLLCHWKHVLMSIKSFKGRIRRLRPKALILDDPLVNPYDGLKVLFGPPVYTHSIS